MAGESERSGMYKLTERRLEKAKPILEKYRAELHGSGSVMARDLERELKDCWNTGYRELKDIFIQLSKITHYRYLAAFYMEHSAQGRVVSEFWSPLVELYGMSSRKEYHDPETDQKREAFWQKFNTVRGRGNGHDTNPASP
jgi:hypothetical protein